MKKYTIIFVMAFMIMTALPIQSSAESLPSKYDLRDRGLVTSVKNQENYEVCWSFATMASLESNLMAQGIVKNDVDLSEAHLIRSVVDSKSSSTLSKYAGKDQVFSDTYMSTNYYSAAATLARGFGAVPESVYPFSLFTREGSGRNLTEKEKIRSAYELKDAIFVDVNTTEKKYDEEAYRTAKQLIMKNGAIASKIYYPARSKWKEVFGSKSPIELKTYYSTYDHSNHAVTIIGWDDDFNDFKSENKPAGPGAWIVKDSYGSDFHGDGFFYMSYYSPCLTQFISYVGQKNSGRQIYQYDGVGVGDYIITKKDNISGANCYKARTDILLDQVMTFTPEANCTVNVKIYVGKNGSSPASGSKLFDKSYKQTYAGYSRVNLGKKVGIPKGADFSVVISTKTPGGKHFVPFELQEINGDASFPAIVKARETYIKKNGKWSMISSKSKVKDEYGDTYRMCNAIVKTFGYKGGKKAQTIKADSSVKMKKGAKLKLKVKRTKGSGKLVYQTSDAGKATISPKGLVTAKKKGTVKITVYTLPTSTYKSAKKTIKITIN